MGAVDYIIVGIFLLSCLISVWRGFLKEAFSLGAWLAAGTVTFMFASAVSVLAPDFVQSPTVRLGITAVVLFVVTLFTGGLINYLVHKAIAKVGLSGTDRLLGLLFGLARGAVIAVVLVVLAGLTPLPQESWWQSALLVHYFVTATLWLQSYMPDQLAAYLSY